MIWLFIYLIWRTAPIIKLKIDLPVILLIYAAANPEKLVINLNLLGRVKGIDLTGNASINKNITVVVKGFFTLLKPAKWSSEMLSIIGISKFWEMDLKFIK